MNKFIRELLLSIIIFSHKYLGNFIELISKKSNQIVCSNTNSQIQKKILDDN